MSEVKRWWHTVGKKKLKGIPSELAHKRRIASVKREREKEERKKAYEESKKEARKSYEKARKKEMIKRARERGRQAARPLGGLRGIGEGLVREARIARGVKPKRKKRKAKKKYVVIKGKAYKVGNGAKKTRRKKRRKAVKKRRTQQPLSWL